MSEAASTRDANSAPLAAGGLTSVIIVAADSGAGLSDCVEHALGSDVAIDVIVVDNASTDGSVDRVAERWEASGRVRVLRNAANLGFGTACNRGAAIARGDAFLFLNPDCEVVPDTVRQLRAVASDASIGLLGVAIVDADGRGERASRRRDPTLSRALMTVTGLAGWELRWPACAGVALPIVARPPDVERVDAVSGALMYLPRSVFERVQGFDENYFLHAEDLDLCRRVRDAGFGVACANTLTVVHRKGGSSHQRPLFVAWHKHRGMWRWFTKFDPAARNLLLRGAVWAALWITFGIRAGVLVAGRLAGGRTVR